MSSVRFQALLIVSLCCRASLADDAVPFLGNEISFLQWQAKPEQRVGKTFFICGGLKFGDYYNFEYADAETTHRNLEFRFVKRDATITGDGVYLYLSRAVSDPIINRLQRELEGNPDSDYILVRAKVTVFASRFDISGWEMAELLDVQICKHDLSGWQQGILQAVREASEEEARRAAAVEEEELRRRKAELERLARERVPKFRLWTDRTGKYSTKAKFGGLIAGSVKLVKEDGTSVSVDLEQLSDADRKYIENRAKEK